MEEDQQDARLAQQDEFIDPPEARENKHVWMQGNKQPSSSSHKRVVSEEWDRSPEKFWRMGEEDVPKETGHHHHKWGFVFHPVQAEDLPLTPKVDHPGNEPQMYKQKI